MKLNRRRLALLGVFGLIVALFWAYRHQPAISSIDASSIHSLDVTFGPWGEDFTVAAGGHTNDSRSIANLIDALRTAELTQDHKCGSRGVITLHRTMKRNLQLQFLPGHHAEWYEFRYAGSVYRVPKQDFVNAMKTIGVEVPLECQ